jgi:hypothetical protein
MQYVSVFEITTELSTNTWIGLNEKTKPALNGKGLLLFCIFWAVVQYIPESTE